MGIDSVEGFVRGSRIKEELCLTVTSIYDPILNRQIPVLVSIMFGKTTQIYKLHFDHTFESL